MQTILCSIYSKDFSVVIQIYKNNNKIIILGFSENSKIDIVTSYTKVELIVVIGNNVPYFLLTDFSYLGGIVILTLLRLDII